MWESSIYKFRKKKYDNSGRRKNIDIIIDVTGSVPTMSTPGDLLKGVFKALTKDKSKKIKILDIGAGKLRNTLYFLKKGFFFYAVEFPELAERLPKAKAIWDRAKKYPNFKKLIFPKDFLILEKKLI